jgi:ATP-dependent Lhr-like helicase
MREALATEAIPGGFSTIYPVLKAMEESGRLRRGYFVSGLGAAQFALPGALDRLRSLRTPREQTEIAVLAATDPANPYGAALKMPAIAPGGASAAQARAGAEPSEPHPRGPVRNVGSIVILVDGALVAYLARGDRQLLTWLPDTEPERSRAARAIADVLIARAREGDESPRGMLLEEIDGSRPAAHPLAPFLLEAGFIEGALGFAPVLKSSSLAPR